jgi:adenine-specific DNA-methyltransferase
MDKQDQLVMFADNIKPNRTPEDMLFQVITEIAPKQPYYAVFRDSSMASDSVATNFEQIFETYSPTTVREML